MSSPPLKSRRRRTSTAIATVQPVTATSRIVKKLVLRGQAHQDGARYHLYLKVTISPSSSSHTAYPLFPDANSRLINAHVDPLTSTGGYPPLQESAAEAAGYLGIPMSSTSATTLDHLPLPRITISNYAVVFAVPILPVDDTKEDEEPTLLSYLVSLEVETDLVARPPRAPYTLRLPIPRCLHSRIHFAFPSQILDAFEEVEVRVEPPLGPRARRGRKSIENGQDDAKSSVTANSEDSNDIDEADEAEEDAHVVRGLFPSTDCIILRWNEVGAGKLHPDDELPALMCDSVKTESDISYSLEDEHHGREAVSLHVKLRVSLQSAFSPGIGSPLCFPLIIEPYGQSVQLSHVDVKNQEKLRSWHIVGGMEQNQTSSITPYRSQGSSVTSLVPSEDGSDSTVDLLATRPPKELDASLDVTADVTAQLSSPSGTISDSSLRAVVLYFDDTVFSVQGGPLEIDIDCRLTISLPSQGRSQPTTIPVFTIPTAFAHQVLVRLNPSDGDDIPLYVSHSAQPSFSAQAVSSLQYEVLISQDQRATTTPETCYLHRFNGEEDTDSSLTVNTLAADVSAPEPLRSAGLVRPMPLYDAITLHDDESSLPSTIASLSLSLWPCERKADFSPTPTNNTINISTATASLRIFGQMECSWPAMLDGRQLDEMDLWLPQLDAQGPVIACYVEVDGRRVEPTKNDAGESLCLHVRKPIRNPQEDDDVFARKLLIVFEYPPSTPKQPDHDMASKASLSYAATATSLPVPLFSQEVVCLQVTVHHTSTTGTSTDRRCVVAPDFDHLTDATAGCTTVRKFRLPALTPLDLHLLPVLSRRTDRDGIGSLRSLKVSTQRLLLGSSSTKLQWLLLLLASLAVVQISLRTSVEKQGLEVQGLMSKVEQLGYAANVVFEEGFWKPESTITPSVSGSQAGRTGAQAEADGNDDDDEGAHPQARSEDPFSPFLATGLESREEGEGDPKGPVSYSPLPRTSTTARQQTTTTTETQANKEILNPLSPSLRRNRQQVLLRTLAWPFRVLSRGAGVIVQVLWRARSTEVR